MAFFFGDFKNPLGLFTSESPIGYPIGNGMTAVDPKGLFVNTPMTLSANTKFIYSSFPGISFGTNFYEYEDVDYDPELRNKVVRYFLSKLLSFMADSYSDLLNHIVVKGNSYDVIKTDSEKENKDSMEVRNKKIEYIKNHVLSKRLVAKLLERFTKETKMKWWDLRDNTEIVADYLRKKLHKVMNDMQ